MNDIQSATIAGKILGKIKKEDIHPEASWKFILRKTALWIGISVSGVLAAFSLSMLLFPFISVEPNFLTFGIGRLFSSPVIRLIPIPWIVFLLIFVPLVVIEFHNTRHGYRYRIAMVASGLILMIAIGARAFKLLGVDGFFDQKFRDSIPAYGQFSETPTDFWSQEREGYLAGTILSSEPGSFTLQDLDGDTVNIQVERDTVLYPNVNLEQASEVKIVGTMNEDRSLKAEKIYHGAPKPHHGKEPEGGDWDDTARTKKQDEWKFRDSNAENENRKDRLL